MWLYFVNSVSMQKIVSGRPEIMSNVKKKREKDQIGEFKKFKTQAEMYTSGYDIVTGI